MKFARHLFVFIAFLHVRAGNSFFGINVVRRGKLHPAHENSRPVSTHSESSGSPLEPRRVCAGGGGLGGQMNNWQAVASAVGVGLVTLDGSTALDAQSLFNCGAVAVPIVLFAAFIFEALWVRFAEIDSDDIIIRTSSYAEGQGAFAARDFLKGDFLAKYRGESLDAGDLIRRYYSHGVAEPAGSLIRDRPDYVWKVNDNFFTDARDPNKANWCRFVNHARSCPPNLQLESGVVVANVNVVTWGARWPCGGAYLFAATEIHQGGELCCDYGPRYWVRRDPPAYLPASTSE